MRYLVVVLVLLLLAFFSMFAWASPSPGTQESDLFVGEWKGSLTVAGVTLEFTITFSRDEKTLLGGTIDIPAQGASGIHLGDIKVEGSKISFAIDDPGAQGNPTFEGALDETGKTITGTFSQSGYEGTFSMDKQESETAAGETPITPAPSS
ncbi:MAG: hypothetical protein OEW18_12690 [Candidatus Aminicenantes bacterium]|nr:hypothetical protein [Candidatus Aminicenantes bacterium]